MLPVYSYIFAVAYIAVMISYFFSETSGNFKRRAVNKITLASMFWIYALVMFLTKYELTSMQLIFMIGITFSYLGDILLLWSFVKGGIVFGIGNAIIAAFIIVYMSSLGVPFAAYWWFLLIFAFFVGLFLVLYKKGFYKNLSKPMIYCFVPYIASVTFHGTLSLALIFVTAAYGLFNLKLGLIFFGCILFMISDYFISWHNFRDKESKAILRLNSGTYFTGLMLIVLSFTLA